MYHSRSVLRCEHSFTGLCPRFSSLLSLWHFVLAGEGGGLPAAVEGHRRRNVLHAADLQAADHKRGDGRPGTGWTAAVQCGPGASSRKRPLAAPPPVVSVFMSRACCRRINGRKQCSRAATICGGPVRRDVRGSEEHIGGGSCSVVFPHANAACFV